MKLKFVFILSLLLFQMACDIPKKKPENILSENKMAEVLVDIQILEATYSSRLLYEDDRNERMERYYQEIFEKHNISREAFNESYSYYEDYPLILESIYEKVLEQLETQQTKEEMKEKKLKAKKKMKKKKDKSEKLKLKD